MYTYIQTQAHTHQSWELAAAKGNSRRDCRSELTIAAANSLEIAAANLS